MDIRFCSRCGSPAVPGTDRCPNCGSYYDERMNYTQNNSQQYYNNQPLPPSGKKTSTAVVVVIIISVMFVFMILSAILIPAFIGYTAKARKHNVTHLSSEYNYYNYEYGENEDYEYGEDNITTQCLINDPEFGQNVFKGTYTDDDGEYDSYADSEKIYDIYTDNDTGNIKKIRITFDENMSSWIKETETYDSILHNYIADFLMDLCNYSWGDAQDYLDTFSLAEGMGVTDENGYIFYLDVDSAEINFSVSISE